MLSKKEMISKLKGKIILMKENENLYDIVHVSGNDGRRWIITDVGEDMFEAQFYLDGKPKWEKKNFSFTAIRSISKL